MMRRAVSLCADDYALSPTVSAAIRELAQARRLSAVSCMTVWPDWPVEAPALAEMRGTIDIGLHLVLTDAPTPLGDCSIARAGRLGPLPRLLAASHLRRLRRSDVEDEVRRQLDSFEAATGFPPDFVDGHRHVHVLPTVRDVVLDLYGNRLDPTRTWLRVPTARPVDLMRIGGSVGTAAFIDRLSRPIHRAVRERSLLSNQGFYGVNRFRDEDVARLFETWLAAPGRHPLVMCHPGRIDAELLARDPVHAAREREFAYLQSDAFADYLERTRTILRNPGRSDADQRLPSAPKDPTLGRTAT